MVSPVAGSTAGPGPDALETVTCALCGADRPRFLFEGWDRLHGVPGRFRVVQCPECGLCYLNPRPAPSAIGAYYPEAYEPHLASRQAAGRRLLRWDQGYEHHKRLRAIGTYAPPGRLLDVGCGTGAFLDYARGRGWEVQGVELMDAAAAYCREQLGLDVVTGDLLSAGFGDQRFDVVTLWNVFEHLHDPRAALAEIRRILRPAGLLVLACPSLDSLDARIFGPAWVGYEVPRHLYAYSRDTLDRMLGESGFVVLRRRCLAGSYSTFFYSVRMWLAGRGTPAAVRLLVQRAEHSRLARLASVPYFWVVDALGKGPVVTVIAHLERSR